MTRSRNPRHYLFYCNIVLLLILLSEIGFYFFVFPKVAVNKIELESDLPLSDADVRELLGFQSARNFYSVDIEELTQRAESFALVDEITIRKEFPDRLKVNLRSRKPVLVMLQKALVSEETAQQGQGTGAKDGQKGKQEERTSAKAWRSIPILVDAEGVMFQVGLGYYDDVPVLSGLALDQGSLLNSRLPQALYPLVADLGILKEKSPKLYAMLSEVHAEMKIANLETDIYLEDVDAYIKTNGEVDAHTIETAMIALEVLRRSREKVRFLDMRTTGIVYRSIAQAANGSEESNGSKAPKGSRSATSEHPGPTGRFL